MMNRSPVMVISRMVTSPVRMTTCFMGSMPAYSPDWVMVILSVFSAWEELSEDSSGTVAALGPGAALLLRGRTGGQAAALRSHGALLCRTCRLRGEILHCQGQEHCQYHSASQNPAPDPGRTVPFSFCHTSTSLLCPPGSSSALYAIISRRTVPAVVISSRSGLPGSVSPAGESSSTRSITNRGRCLTSM